ncbi:Uncharacterised protein [Klebsiella pneumoniae]|uniref:Uncharacterized protein n=1 Tax=Klebsiella pneumoniae TaxID=573 RepID=A0A377XQK7_KLEPN|nr:Uncharacterised protein [Klebsiella pneumoniae]
MANQLAKDLEIMFENYVEGFEAACVVSRNAKKFRPVIQQCSEQVMFCIVRSITT